MKTRCSWINERSSELDTIYHDREWGVPIHDDRLLFEFLILEGAQAGLSWSTILKKRENYRKAYDNFDPVKIAAYNQQKVLELLQNEGIIRNRLKVAASIANSKAYLKVVEEFGNFDKYIWQFVNYKPLQNSWTQLSEVPVATDESVAMSKDLLKRGFKFVGPTICYAFMQAVGMVNDHAKDCFRFNDLSLNR